MQNQKQCPYNLGPPSSHSDLKHNNYDFKKAHATVRRKVVCNVSEGGISMKLSRLIKICLNETYNKV